MVENTARALDATFHALAHPTRRAMLRILADGKEHSVGELAAPFDVSLAASSKHLHVLEEARLVHRHVAGRTHAVRLAAERLELVVDWTEELHEVWEQSFSRLDTVLEELKAAPARGRPRRKNKRKD